VSGSISLGNQTFLSKVELAVKATLPALIESLSKFQNKSPTKINHMKSPLKLNLTKLLFVLFIITPSFTFSQNNGDSLKYEIIKETISFLAIDKATFNVIDFKKDLKACIILLIN
jgi:hypothetical protein